MSKVFHIIAAIILGLAHVFFADVLFFYGTVINPELSHKILNAIALVLTLPFSALLLIPNLSQGFILIQAAVIGFWMVVYYWLILKVCKACCK